VPAGEAVRISASRELLASRPDVWDFLGEPYHLPDWWPGASGVQPDRRGSAAGARWQVVASAEPTLLRRPESTGTLVVTASARPVLFAFHLTGENLDVRIDLEAVAAGRTRATITVEGPWLIAFRRTLARRALGRLYALCQTAASL
jgi:uncharacterized protein YndB with AHSA1/START domain